MKIAKSELPQRLEEVEDRFVDLWDTMSSLWGISPTMAEIPGLLYITGSALSMDDIMERLKISRGNVSMNLSKLVEWGLVRRAHRRGDRRDYYESLSDVWEMFTLVAHQRKRREIDPILGTLRACRSALSAETLGKEAAEPQATERFRRIDALYSALNWMDSVARLRALVAVRPRQPLVLAHLNHQRRGADSAADEDFVRALHQELAACAIAVAVLHVERRDVAAAAIECGMNLEATARRLRY